jgi:hypothetical protein
MRYKVFVLAMIMSGNLGAGGNITPCSNAPEFCQTSEQLSIRRCKVQPPIESFGEITWFNAGYLRNKKQILCPTDGQPVGIEFVPTEGSLRNRRLRILLVADEKHNERRLYTIYCSILGYKSPGWEMVGSVEVLRTIKQVPVIFENDGKAIIGEKSFELMIL